MSLEELEIILEGCKNQSRLSQKRLHQHFYNYGMSICMRFSNSQEEAQEICQDGFVKAFLKMEQCSNVGSLKPWLRRIFINAAIDHYRKYKQQYGQTAPIEEAEHIAIYADHSGLEGISIDEKLLMVRRLPTSYRMAFNLYVLEGFTTVEIAQQLHITEGTVRSNLQKARAHLQKMIAASEKIHFPHE